MTGDVIIVGGGTAGIEAAGQLAKAGCKVTLIEKDKEVGGHVRSWTHLFPDRRDSREVIQYQNGLIHHENLTLLKGTTIESLVRNKKQFIIKTNHGDQLTARALIIATGFDLFKSEKKEEYGYGIYNNVITSSDLEKMLRDEKITLTDGRVPESVGIVHCVGSRDEKAGNFYCSKLCCVTAVKQAIEIRNHLSDSKVFCFYMDMRMGGALYEELYREAQEKWGVSFIRGKVSEASETIENKLLIKVEDTLAGRPLRMKVDMLVLMAGMEMSEGGKQIAAVADLKTGENRFFSPADNHFGNNKSNVDGVFYAGTCTAPMNITETISHARAAVIEVIDYLKDGNH
jgi:heterodisulfide reductase subunit A2